MLNVTWRTRRYCSYLLPRSQNCDEKNVCYYSSFRMGLAISLVSDVKEKVQLVLCRSHCIMYKLKRKKQRCESCAKQCYIEANVFLFKLWLELFPCFILATEMHVWKTMAN